ncbi:MAG TPA: phosphoesterase [Anaeromyxobacteraceae bacterium]
MRLKLLYHANCFDGAASAAVLSRFLEGRERLSETAFAPVQHQQGDPFGPDAFDGDLNAVVDFRFSPSPGLHWWFDHHQSAFQAASDRAAFEADRSGTKFWDPAAPSNTGFMSRVLGERFGWRAPDLEELVRWADVIDAARFPSARVAVRLEEPALRIMAVLEASKDPDFPARLIRAFQGEPLAAIAAEPWVAGPLAPVLARHARALESYRALARLDRGVVEADLSEAGVEAPNKFIPYDLFPAARYAVTVTCDAKRAKVGVGSNPWSAVPRTHDIARICERYGGGGHPVVGAVSLAPERLLDARRIANEIAETLRGPPAP